jgi:acyl-CoA synthetase (AMP-forming)/AMP-acid ligase II
VNSLRSLGLTAGDHVALLAWNCTEMIETEVALYKGGFVKVPINARLTLDETVQVLSDASADVLIADREHAVRLAGHRRRIPNLKSVIVIGGLAGDEDYEAVLQRGEADPPSIEVAADDVAVLHYTSGSSGVLKAAMQTFGNRHHNLLKYDACPWRHCQPGDVMAHVAPLTHATGLFALQVFAKGGCNRVFARFDAGGLLEAIERERINRLFLVPTMINRMVALAENRDYDLSSLNSVFYAAAPISPSLLERALKLFGPIMVQGYGGGEVSALLTMLTEADHAAAQNGNARLLSSCGRSFYAPDDIRLVDDGNRPVPPGEVGEIIVSGPTVMKGYWAAPELTADVLRDGYYHTGDLATMDAEGYLYIVDRKKEMIVSGGFNVYPLEVEKVLHDHPAVFEVAVVGVPHPEWGEEVKAVVVLKEEASTTADEILAYGKAHLAGFKQPKSVDLVDDLPKNDAGKVVRRLVRDRYWVGQARKVG